MDEYTDAHNAAVAAHVWAERIRELGAPVHVTVIISAHGPDRCADPCAHCLAWPDRYPDPHADDDPTVEPGY